MLTTLHVQEGVGRLEGQGQLGGHRGLGVARQTLYDLRVLKKLKGPFPEVLLRNAGCISVHANLCLR